MTNYEQQPGPDHLDELASAAQTPTYRRRPRKPGHPMNAVIITICVCAALAVGLWFLDRERDRRRADELLDKAMKVIDRVGPPPASPVPGAP
ncbi:MAG: hypothetical protein JWO31_3634 [Phycisphaerales bacterium]|nr:hypothetical protein [Phycisphaerales bacterium]